MKTAFSLKWIPACRFVFVFVLAAAALPGDGQALAQQEKEESGLLTNADFTNGTQGWELVSWAKKGSMTVDKAMSRGTEPSLRIDNAGWDDTAATQKVTLKPFTKYRLEGYIRTKDVVPMESGRGQGATLCLMGGYTKSEVVGDTKSWTKVSLEFATAERTDLAIGARLGHHSAIVRGTAWFCGITLRQVGKARK